MSVTQNSLGGVGIAEVMPKPLSFSMKRWATSGEERPCRKN